MNHLKGKKCYEHEEDSQKIIEIKTCLENTCEVCCLSENEGGTQKIGLINWRSHLSTIEVKVSSLSNQIKIFPSNSDTDSDYEYCEEVTVPPSQYGNKKEYKMNIPTERMGGGILENDTIQVSITISCQEALEDTRDGPVLHSEITLE